MQKLFTQSNFKFTQILVLYIFFIRITFFWQNEYDIIFDMDFKFYFSEYHSILSLDIPLNADIEDKTIYLKSSIMEFNVTLKDFEKLFELSPDKCRKKLRIHVPINGVYDGALIDGSKNRVITKIRFIASDTFYDNPDQTQIYCIGNDDNTRWCRAKNIGLVNNDFVIFSPYDIKLIPKNIVRISSTRFMWRKPSWSPTTTKVYKKIPNNCIIEKSPVQISVNVIDQTWHIFTEAFLPTFWTMSSHLYNIQKEKWNDNSTNPDYGIKINTSWKILDFKPKMNHYYLELLTDYPIMTRPKKLTCYKELFIGLRKSHYSKQPEGSDFRRERYIYDKLGIRGFRDHVIKRLNTENVSTPNTKQPVVLLVQRKCKTRVIQNFGELVNDIKKICPFCNVKEVSFESYTIKEQILMCLNASLVIGIHGSGLTNGFLMKPSTKKYPTCIVEFIPYLYDVCRPWYQELSTTLGIEYIGIKTKRENTIPNHGNNVSKLDMIHKRESRSYCRHDPMFRDQNIIVDFKQLNQLLQPFIDKLNESITMKEEMTPQSFFGNLTNDVK